MTLFTLAAGQLEVLKCLWRDTVKSSWIKAIIKTVHVVIKKKNKNKQTKKEKKRKKTPRLRCEPKIFGIFSAFHVLL